MNIEHLREFTYLAETLSFSITARHAFISTSVLSKHIAALEDVLGVRLFERDSHGVTLTLSGKRFYNDIAPVLMAFDRAVENVRPENAGKKTLRVGYLRNAARPFLSTFVHFIEQHYPQINLEITCMEYRELVFQHRAHALDALLSMDVDPEAAFACDSEPIYTDRIYAIVDKKHPLARLSTGISVHDLSGLSCLLPDPTSYPGYAQRCEEITHAGGSVLVKGYYKDMDTLFFRLAENDAFGFSSGHNYALFKDRTAFLPLIDFDTSYVVGARWLRAIDPELVSITREAAASCAKAMKTWSDGVF